MRVQIPAYTDRWMMGDRYGEIVKTKLCLVPLGQFKGQRSEEIAWVKLDKSSKTIRVRLDDCTEV